MSILKRKAVWRGAMAAVALLVTSTVNAAEINVTTFADEFNEPEKNETCSLREAIVAANFNMPVGGCPAGEVGEDTILLLSGDYTLTRSGCNEDYAGEYGDLDIVESLKIQGAGRADTFVQWDDVQRKDRIFDIWLYMGDSVIRTSSQVLAEQVPTLKVEISELTARRGEADSCGDIGADRGGGIRNGRFPAELRLNNVYVEDNEAASGGGGIYNSGHLELFESAVLNNRADGEEGSHGGGIYSVGGLIPLTLIIDKSTVSGNTATEDGAGIYLAYDMARISNSTISWNTADESGGGIALCGDDAAAYLHLSNATITKNTSAAGGGSYPGGGIADVCKGETLLTMRNTILAQNIDLNDRAERPDCAMSSNDITSDGYNLIGDNRGCGAADPVPWDGTDLVGDVDGGQVPYDPELGPLAENGGPTMTHALLTGSHAIDGANPAGCYKYTGDADEELTDDQRSVERPLDGDGDGEAICDIGAYEYYLERCGNGIIDPGEECDDDGDNSDAPNAACRTDCTLRRCGDAIIDDEFGEQCDDDGTNSDAPNALCRTDCLDRRCGDSIVDTEFGEECDDGPEGSDLCFDTCKLTPQGSYVLSGDGAKACGLIPGGAPIAGVGSLSLLSAALGVLVARRRRRK